MPLDLSSLKQAVAAHTEAVRNAGDDSFMEDLTPAQRDLIRAGVIQYFEFTYELCWKMIQRWLRLNVSPEAAAAQTRKDLFRIAAQQGLIRNPQDWFGYQEARNLTSHTYSELEAERVFEAARRFVDDATCLLAQLETRND
jgi:nucleotidyltransferase substrate binding protein (TIGR01987 family)